MKPILKAAMLATAGLALASSGKAAIVGSASDLFVGITDTSDGHDVVVDIGQASIYANATSTINLDSDIGATLASLFPVGGVSSLTWSVFGGQASGTSPTIWLTGAQNQTVGANKTSLDNTINGKFVGVQNQYAGGTGYDSAIGTSTTSEEILNLAANTGSYTYLAGAPGDFGTGNSASQTDGALATLYSYKANADGTAVGIGQFTVTAGGDLEYFIPSAAVPEPATYGALAGLGLLVMALRRQFASKNA